MAMPLFPYDIMDDGEGFSFDLEVVLPNLFRIFGVYNKSVSNNGEPVEITLSGDGAKLTADNHCTVHIKMTDKDALDPKTGNRLCLHEEEGNAQTRDLLFPLMGFIGSDAKENVIKYVKPFYERLLATIRKLNMSVLIRFTGDLKWHWTCTCKGGGCKTKNLFCPHCATRSDDVQYESEVPCDKCKEEGLACYHVEKLDLSRQEDLRKEYNDLMRKMNCPTGQISGQRQSRWLRVPFLPTNEQIAGCRENIECIDFQTSGATLADINRFGDNVRQSLVSRNMPVRGNLNTQRNQLKARLLMETKAKKLDMKLEHMKTPEGALYTAQDMVSCTLHLEMRVGEKIVDCILRKGLSGCVRDVDTGIGRVQQEFVCRIEEYVKGTVLAKKNGTPGYWKMPVEKSANDGPLLKMTGVSFKKAHARAFLTHIDGIIDICVQDENDRNILKTSLACYKSAIALLGKKTNYTDEEVDEFQNHIDSWYRPWVEMFGLETCTNYIHALASGHLVEEMRRLGCMYRYSQEGLEAMNALIKSYFFRRTPRGGGRGIANTNRFVPLAKWLQRRMYILFTMGRHEENPQLESAEETTNDREIDALLEENSTVDEELFFDIFGETIDDEWNGGNDPVVTFVGKDDSGLGGGVRYPIRMKTRLSMTKNQTWIHSLSSMVCDNALVYSSC